MSSDEKTYTSIAAFLFELARDDGLRERWDGAQSTDDDHQAARALMAGLTRGQQDVVLSGNLALIRAALDYEYRSGAARDVLGEYESGAGYQAAPGGGVSIVVTWRAPAPTW